MNPNSASETLIAEEVDRLIGSASIRIAQQRVHIKESSGSPQEVISGKAVLTRMLKVLKKLKIYRTHFA